MPRIISKMTEAGVFLKVYDKKSQNDSEEVGQKFVITRWLNTPLDWREATLSTAWLDNLNNEVQKICYTRQKL